MKQNYICHCNKVTFERFDNFLKESNSHDFNLLCKDIGVGMQCAACLPSLEDTFIRIKGGFQAGKFSFSPQAKRKSFLKKAINFLDFLSGESMINLKGVVPILFNKDISTWLVVSNSVPNGIKTNAVNYLITCDIYNAEGELSKTTKNIVKPNEIFQICLNKYLKSTGSSNNINVGTAVLSRIGKDKGYRGSTRPHFYFQTKGSMAALHVQHGGTKKLLFEISKIGENEKGWVFVHNRAKKIGKFKWSVNQQTNKKIINLEKGSLNIKPLGCKLINVPISKEYANRDIQILIESSVLFKEYIVLSSSDLNYISVDHT